MNKPLVSVILPVYNGEKTIQNTIKSILCQTYPFFELIIIDDGSFDKTSAIIDSLSKKDKRVITLHKKNGGVSAARNDGLKLAKGQYVSFIDSDDTYRIDFLEKMINYIHLYDANLIVCGYMMLNGEKRSVEEISFKSSFNEIKNDEFIDVYSKGLLNVPWNKLYKKEYIFDYFIQSYSMGEDLIFNLQYLTHAKSICFVPDCLYNYDSNVFSLSSKFHVNSLDAYDEAQNLFETLLCKKTFDSEELISVLWANVNIWLTKLFVDANMNYRVKKKLFIFFKNHNCYKKVILNYERINSKRRIVLKLPFLINYLLLKSMHHKGGKK